jgi:hypothetical protein
MEEDNDDDDDDDDDDDNDKHQSSPQLNCNNSTVYYFTTRPNLFLKCTKNCKGNLFYFVLITVTVGCHMVFRPFRKTAKPTIGFVVSVRMEKFESHWTDFREILHPKILRNSVEKI